MDFMTSALIGYFFGFALGVGCALAVLYSIYYGGYGKAVQDSLLEEKPGRYLARLAKARQRAARLAEKGSGAGTLSAGSGAGPVVGPVVVGAEIEAQARTGNGAKARPK